MSISSTNRQKLKAKGLKINDHKDGDMSLIKEKGIAGNFIPEWRNDDTEDWDCPAMQLKFKNNKYVAIVWEYIPGPGPGEFELTFDNEEEAVSFIEHYYFEKNDYFEAKKADVNCRRDTYNINEVRKMMEAVALKLEKEFSTDEINVERGENWYHKIPIDKWLIKEPIYEKPASVKTDSGLISYDLFILRSNVAFKEELTSEDLQRLSAILLELSLRMKEKEGGETSSE